MAQSQWPVIVVSAEIQEARTDERTAEVYPARASLYVLISERGEPLIKRVGCSMAAAKRFQSANTFRVGAPLTSTTLLVDSSEYKLADGKQGVSNKLVEEGTETRQRGSFAIEPTRPVEPARPPAIAADPRLAVNGQVPQRQPVSA